MPRIQKTIAAALIALAGCASTAATPTKISNATAAKAEQDMRDKLRDPASGQFRNFRAYDVANGERAICADANARNGMGGLTGFQPMVIFYRGGDHIVFFDDLAAYECSRLSSGTSSRM